MDKTPRQIIAEKGVDAFAAALGKEKRTIEMWRFRNRLPRASWPEITQAFPDLDIETLQRLEANQGRAA